MRFEVDMGDVGVSLDRFAHRVGETTEQATVRYGVAAARSLAEATEPKRSTAGSRKKKAAATMRRVVEPMGARDFNKLAKQKKPRVKLGGQWVPLRNRGLIHSVRDLWSIIEIHRVNGKTKKLPPTERYICKQADFNKVVRSRTKLWGAAKGAWIGAGQDVARRQSGMNRISIGKNFLSWAQKHASKGRGIKVGRDHDTTIHLTNNTTGAAKPAGLSIASAQAAIQKARRAVWAYYAGELRRMRIGKGSR
jgi:hypothetical protein